MTYLVTYIRDGRAEVHELSTRAQAQALADYVTNAFAAVNVSISIVR